MDEEVKAKFRAFADRFGRDEAVLDTGLKGADLHHISAMMHDLIEIPEIDIGTLGGFGNLRPVIGMDHLVPPARGK